MIVPLIALVVVLVVVLFVVLVVVLVVALVLMIMFMLVVMLVAIFAVLVVEVTWREGRKFDDDCVVCFVHRDAPPPAVVEAPALVQLGPVQPIATGVFRAGEEAHPDKLAEAHVHWRPRKDPGAIGGEDPLHVRVGHRRPIHRQPVDEPVWLQPKHRLETDVRRPAAALRRAEDPHGLRRQVLDKELFGEVWKFVVAVQGEVVPMRTIWRVPTPSVRLPVVVVEQGGGVGA
mmetsp:Transcript_122128/g.353070  ORF Transcript_122128/g.353070 Transcript_122128/m.353070 type:complete len:231 (+) Transcript_122128:295-987(+)